MLKKTVGERWSDACGVLGRGLAAPGGGFSPAVVYCKTSAYRGCVVSRGVAVVATPVVGVACVGVGTPGVGVRLAALTNRGGQVNRVGHRRELKLRRTACADCVTYLRGKIRQMIKLNPSGSAVAVGKAVGQRQFTRVPHAPQARFPATARRAASHLRRPRAAIAPAAAIDVISSPCRRPRR